MDQPNTERPVRPVPDTEPKHGKQRPRPTIAELEELLAEEKLKQERKQKKLKPVKEKQPKAPKPVKEKKEIAPKAPKPVKEKKPKEEKPIKEKAPKPVKEKKEKAPKAVIPVPEKAPKPPKPAKQKQPKPEKSSGKRAGAAAAASGKVPDQQSLEQALARQRRRKLFFSLLRKTLVVLITVAAIAALIATLFMPVLKVYSGSMAPGLLEGDIVVSLKEKSVENGEVIAFYYNNKLFVKRVVAGPGETVLIDEEGGVYVNGVLLDEPYVEERSPGVSDVAYPYVVPEDSYFVLGDSRVNSSDSRSSVMGCVSTEDILGRVLFRVWPLNRISVIR